MQAVHITGTTTITSLGTAPQAGAVKWIIFDDVLTLIHGANLNLQGSANITTAAGDFARVYADTTTQFDVQYFKANGQSVVSGCNVQTFTGNGTWNKPSGYSVNALVKVECWGAGGGGGLGGIPFSGGGGGGGGYVRAEFLLSALGATGTVTIGTAGAGATVSGNGGAGGNTTFGSLVTAYGGGGGGGSGSDPSGGGGGGGEYLTAGGYANGSTAGTAGTIGGSAGSTSGTNASHAGTIWGGASSSESSPERPAVLQ